MSSNLTVHAPFDRRILAEIPLNSAAEAEAFLAEAAALHASRQPLPKDQRMAILERAAALLRERLESFAVRIAQEGGKPLLDARVEAERAADGLIWAARALTNEEGRSVPMGLNAASRGRAVHIVHEPIGPVLSVSAFNHPLNLIVHQVAPAIAAGCPVLIKPAMVTPLSAIALIDLLREAGLPSAWARVVLVDNEVAERLVSDERLAFFSFIGSAKVGWMLRRKLADGVRCALEHGGIAPVLIEPDADLDQVIPLMVKGGYYHAGQVCVSVQRIFVHRDLLADFRERFTAAVADLKEGDPELATTEVGPLILPREAERVASWVDEARSGSADIWCGGERLGESRYAPTIVHAPPTGSRLATTEVFGPVTTVMAYDDWHEAVAIANNVPWSFQAAVFTGNLTRAHEIAGALDASAVMVNDHTAFRVDWMPFAGRRVSGLGIGGILDSFHDLRPQKMIVTRTN